MAQQLEDSLDQTGPEPYEAGSIAESWRQQPGNPAYGTDLTVDELPDALPARMSSGPRVDVTWWWQCSPSGWVLGPPRTPSGAWRCLALLNGWR